MKRIITILLISISSTCFAQERRFIDKIPYSFTVDSTTESYIISKGFSKDIEFDSTIEYKNSDGNICIISKTSTKLVAMRIMKMPPEWEEKGLRLGITKQELIALLNKNKIPFLIQTKQDEFYSHILATSKNVDFEFTILLKSIFPTLVGPEKLGLFDVSIESINPSVHKSSEYSTPAKEELQTSTTIKKIDPKSVEGEWVDCDGWDLTEASKIKITKKGNVIILHADNIDYTLERKSNDLYSAAGGLITLIQDNREAYAEKANIEKFFTPDKAAEMLKKIDYTKRWYLSGIREQAIKLCRTSEVGFTETGNPQSTTK